MPAGSHFCSACGAQVSSTVTGAQRVPALLSEANLLRMRARWVDAENRCIEALRLDLSPDDRPSVTLRIDPGSAEADRSGQCVLTIFGDPSGPQTIPATNHLPGLVANDFVLLQPPDPTTGSGLGEINVVVKFDGWDYLGGSVWARKVSTLSKPPPVAIFTGHSGESANVSETTTLELKHRPE